MYLYDVAAFKNLLYGAENFKEVFIMPSSKQMIITALIAVVAVAIVSRVPALARPVFNVK